MAFPKSPLARVNGLFVFCANEEYKEENTLCDDG